MGLFEYREGIYILKYYSNIKYQKVINFIENIGKSLYNYMENTFLCLIHYLEGDLYE